MLYVLTENLDPPLGVRLLLVRPFEVCARVVVAHGAAEVCKTVQILLFRADFLADDSRSLKKGRQFRVVALSVELILVVAYTWCST